MKAIQDNQMNAPNQPPLTANRPLPTQLNRPFNQPFNSALMRPPLQQPHRPNLVRPICAQDRSIVEKFVDYLVGDGPNNRYGLICKFCYSHNGMALKDEFDYLNFRCCFCNNLNMAKKQRPLAPTLVSYDNAKDNLADETLNESVKKFKLDDSTEHTNESSNSPNNKSQIEEIENRLEETKLDDGETKSEDDEMQCDDYGTSSSKENTQEAELDKDNLKSGEQLNQRLDDMKLSE